MLCIQDPPLSPLARFVGVATTLALSAAPRNTTQERETFKEQLKSVLAITPEIHLAILGKLENDPAVAHTRCGDPSERRQPYCPRLRAKNNSPLC